MDSASLNSQTISHQASPRRGLPEFSDLVLACRYHPFKTIAFGSLTTILFSALACCVVYPTYEAESLVRVKPHQDVVYVDQSSRSDDLAFVHSQEQMALSPPVLAAALADIELQVYCDYIPLHDQSDWLKDRVRVDMQVGSEVLTIAAKHPVPQVSQAICNALTNAYVREITERQKSDQDRRQTELENAAKEAEHRLNELWSELNQVALEVGSENTQSLTIRDELQLQAYRDYAQQLRALQLRGHELARQFEEAQNAIEEPQTTAIQAEIDARVQTDSQVVMARQRIAVIDEQIRNMREIVAHEDSPRLKRLQADREHYLQEAERVALEAIQRIRQNTDIGSQGQVVANVASLQKQIELNDAEKEFLRQRLAEIDTTADRKDKHNGLQLDVARHEVDRQARLTDGLWSSLEELKIERQSQPRVNLMQLAAVPQSPSYDKQLKAIAAVVATCWIITILGTGYFEWRSCTIRHTADVIEHSQFPVFGDVEWSHRNVLRRGGSATHTTGAQQAVAQLLLSAKQTKHIPTLMVTSAMAVEPRHLLAVDMAMAFAALHHKTLLIDFDTAFGRLSRDMKCDSLSGIRQIDVKLPKLRRSIIKTSAGIDFLPLGRLGERVAEVSPHLLVNVLEEVRRDYRSIIVVGPPVLEAAEGLILAAQVEQIVFTVCGGVSHWSELAQAEEATIRAGLTCFGSIIHADRKRQSALLGELTHPSSADEEITVEAAVKDDLSEIEHEIRLAMTYQAERRNKRAIRNVHL